MHITQLRDDKWKTSQHIRIGKCTEENKIEQFFKKQRKPRQLWHGEPDRTAEAGEQGQTT